MESRLLISTAEVEETMFREDSNTSHDTLSSEDFSETYSYGKPITEGLLLSRGIIAQEAAELAQAAWVRGWECRRQLKNRDEAVFWVNTIALN